MISSLERVTFESGASLQRTIEDGKVDLEGKFAIFVVNWDDVMSFRGYSVSVIPGTDHLVQLLKNE
jgi:hypothetical protein